jgi:transposase-like protein
MDMRGSRFTEEQIIAIVREQEAGTKTAEVCRKHGISDRSPPTRTEFQRATARSATRTRGNPAYHLNSTVKALYE